MKAAPSVEAKILATDEWEREHVDAAPTLLTASEILRSETFKRPRRTLATNIPAFNDLVGGGLKTRQQSTWAAPTGTGKTGLAGTIMDALARAGRPIYWLATELDAEEQAARFAALALRIAGKTFTPDDLLSHELAPELAANSVDGLSIYVRRWRRRMGDPFALMRADMTTIRERHGEPAIAVVDYMQKLAVEDEERRRVSVSNVSESLLEIAQDFDTHVMSISSVARALYNAAARKARKAAKDEDPRDWLAVGKESGDIEYDAAVMVYLDVADEKSQLGERNARLVVAKARGGDVGFVGMKFHGPSGLFVPDDTAAESMRPQSGAGQRSRVTEQVVEYLKQHQVDPPTREKLRNEINAGVARIDAAVKELLAEGAIDERTVEYTNKRLHKRTKKVLVLIEEAPDAE